jgi:hypothetical protein
MERLSVKSALLFAFVFVLTFAGSWFYDAISYFFDGRAADESNFIQSQAPVDSKVESDLAKVMTVDLTPDRTEIRDPFIDRGNLSRIADPNAAVVAGTTTSPTPAPASSSGDVAVRNSTPVGNRERNASTQDVTVVVDPASAEATIARIRARDVNLRAGIDAGPESVVFAIEDLRPIGVVSGGDGEQEVMFYSSALDRVISFPVGTQFFDGRLIGLKPDGVEFGTFNAGTVRFKSWGYGS